MEETNSLETVIPFHRKFARALPKGLANTIKLWKNHRYEVVLNLLPTLRKPTAESITVGTKRYRFVRNYILETLSKLDSSKRIKFLNFGCGDGTARHQLFQSEIDETPLTPKYFFSKVDYYTNETYDLNLNQMKTSGANVYFPSYGKELFIGCDYLSDYPENFHKGHLKGNISSDNFIQNYQEHLGSFDIIYSSDVLEHVENPFQAAKNVLSLLKPGGVCITIVPFAYPYHPDPCDYFRFTHEGLSLLFNAAKSKQFDVIHYSYDISDRRDNRKGQSVPIDCFGGWRENWMLLHILKTKEH